MPAETLNVLLALLIFGAFHSLTAAIGFKAIFAALVGPRAYLGLYRLIYNALSVITFLPVLWIGAANPGRMIWEVDGVAALGLRGLQGVGLVGLTISLLQIDGLRFVGIKQALAYLMGEALPLPPEPLSVAGVYRLVRHPLYLFTLMVLWPNPVMPASALGLALGATLYFAAGSLLEEQKLRKLFGEAYVQYQKEVPWMIPFVKFP